VSYDGLLNERADLYRASAVAVSGSGEEQRTFALLKASVPVAINSLARGARGFAATAAGLAPTTWFFAWAPADLDVRKADRFVHAKYGTLEVANVELIRSRVLELLLRTVTVPEAT
jgi:hypothetical protein